MFYPCQFFDILAAQTGWNIVHRHIRADGVSVGEEFKVKKFSVDAYVPEQKMVLEFLGDFYHGNPNKHDPNAMNPSRRKTFGELYTSTYERHKLIAEEGYKVYYVWESEFLKNKKHPRIFDIMHRWDDWEMLDPQPKRVRTQPIVYRLEE
jgi:very-short-patch-repair endonuclease